MEGKETGRYVMMCIYVNKKGLYCVRNVVIVRIEELNWGSWHCGTEIGVDLCVHCSCGCRDPTLQEKGSQADTCGEEIYTRESGTKNRNIRS